jgi:hypothetical protein
MMRVAAHREQGLSTSAVGLAVDRSALDQMRGLSRRVEDQAAQVEQAQAENAKLRQGAQHLRRRVRHRLPPLLSCNPALTLGEQVLLLLDNRAHDLRLQLATLRTTVVADVRSVRETCLGVLQALQGRMTALVEMVPSQKCVSSGL